ncbi:MAG: 4-demethylwyosine synthase TYW1, partial [Candidatus Hydrothermarchaeaceae archaeon]
MSMGYQSAGIWKILEKQGYRIVGRHSAVKICHWTREMLLNHRQCYKAKFYGIKSHRCIQMTPSVLWCEHRCIFCWRSVEYMLPPKLRDGNYDEPSKIVEGSIEMQKKLLSGYWGEIGRATLKEVREANEPRHAAISLAGEPTNYPYINELIEEFHRRNFT